MRTTETKYDGKRILIAVLVVVVALGVAMAVWRHLSEGRPPSDPTSPTELPVTSQPDPSGPSDQAEETRSPDIVDSTEDGDPSAPSDPSQTGSDPEPSGEHYVTSPTEPSDTTGPPSVDAGKDKLSVDKIARFSGRFVEDASDGPVEDVAAILVTNHSERFLDLGTIGYSIDGEKATFIITGLPPGASCWVMEYTGMTMSEGADVQYLGCDTSFRDDVKTEAPEISVRSEQEHLFVTNETGRTLKNVFIYYKNVHSDGNFFGGITYMVEFGDLEPGQTVDKIGGHFTPDGSQIVRIGWQEVQTEETP